MINAWYEKDVVRVCYELVDDIWKKGAEKTTPAGIAPIVAKPAEERLKASESRIARTTIEPTMRIKPTITESMTVRDVSLTKNLRI